MEVLHRKLPAGATLLLALLVTHGASAVAWAQSNPVPFVNNPLVPEAIAPGSQGFTLAVNGTGFVSGSTVYWNGSPRATQFVSQGQLTASISAADVAKPSTAAVTVVSPSPGGGTSLPAYFDIARGTRGASFGEPASPAGSGPLSAVAADLNNDGNVDLAVADVSGTLSILLGNGDGTFQTAVSYSVGTFVSYVVVGDFNGDGKADVAAITGDGAFGAVALLLGNGDGTFQSPILTDVATGALNGPAVGEFNGDGKLDLAVLVNSDSQVAVLLGNGDGTFQNPAEFTAGSGGVGYDGLAVGDFNADGKLDLAANQYYDTAIAVLLGNGDGSFGAPAEYPAARGTGGIIVADLNHDGKLDLATGNILTTGAAIAVLLGNGDGTFQTHVDYATLPFSGAILAADVNADGKLDLAVASNTSNAVQTFLGKGDASFSLVGQFPSGAGPTAILAADLNGAGRVDLVTANYFSNAAGVLDQLSASLSRSLVNFGAVKVGSSKSQAVTVTNIGKTPLRITKITLTGNTSSFSEVTTCRSSLAVGAICTFGPTFKPQSSGMLTAQVNITDSAATQPQIIYLQGAGVQ